jgi:hypothetical protein
VESGDWKPDIKVIGKSFGRTKKWLHQRSDQWKVGCTSNQIEQSV